MKFKLSVAECDGQHSAEKGGHLIKVGKGELGVSGSVLDIVPESTDKSANFDSKNPVGQSETEMDREHDFKTIYEHGKKQNVKKKSEKVNIREIQMSRNEGWSLVVPIKVNNVECQAVIDTAAQVTVISDRIFKKMKCQPQVQEDVILKDATALNNIPAQLVKSVNFILGDHIYNWNSYVAPLSDEVILGIDFLKENQGIVNLVDNQLTLNNKVIPAILKTSSQGQQQKICRVITKKKIVIPPHTMKMTKGCVQQEIEGLCSFCPVASSHFCSPHTLVRIGNKCQIPVNLWNHTDRYFTVKAGTVIGSCMEAEILENENKSPHYQIRSCNVATSDHGGGLSGGRGDCDTETKVKLCEQLPTHVQDMFRKSTSALSDSEASKFANLLMDFQDVFAKSDTDLGCFTAIKHTIDTGESSPVRQQMRRTPIGFQEEEEKHLKSMLECGVITPSTSEWSSAPVLVRKKDGSIRWCIDYRAVNDKCCKQVWPIPSFSQCSELFSGLEYMSTVDLNSGYWQIEMDEKDQHKTAFITKYGLYEYKRMPFGLTNAPATFMRAMTLVLQGLQWKEVMFYLDDVCIIGRNFLHHLSNIQETLSRFRQYDLKLKPRKCLFFQKELTFLGRLVGRNGVTMTKEAVEKVQNWPKPTCVRDVESFLGFANYYRDHIKEFAKHTSILYQLTGSKANFNWTEEHDQIFHEIKSMLTETPLLAYPNNDDLFVLDTDASDTAIGGVLSQVQGGVEKVICYGSFVLSPAQRRYCTTRKELLAVIRFTRQFRHYLLGRRFLLRTDHNCLTWLMRFKNIEGQLARWLEEISQYDMEIVHRPGNCHGNADGLSRIPDDTEYCDKYIAGEIPENLPCGGCKFCTRAHSQWTRFEEEVDDVIPLAIRAVQKGPNVDSESILQYTAEELRDFQLKDPDVHQLLLWKDAEIEPKDSDILLQSRAVKHFWLNKNLLTIRDGVLYYTWKQQDEEKLLLVVPKDLKKEILQGCHDCVLAGHVGIGNTKEKIKRSYIWYGLTSDVEKYVKSCMVCSRNKKANRKAKGHLNSYHSGYPMERIHMDILGPFPKSLCGNQYILMVIDQFTKWVEAFPIPNQAAETIADVLVKEYFAKFGIPLSIHTDQGKNFDGSVMESICKKFNIHKTRTTPYHPSSNGQIERYNRTILQMIRCFLEKEHDWDKNLALLTSAIRGITNRQTGYSANKLMLGREIMLPIDIMLGTAKTDVSETGNYIDTLEQNLSQAYATARKNIQGFQQRQKRDYDVKLIQHQYKLGDLVYEIESSSKIGQSNKLKKMWKGPYIVTKVISPVLYQIKGKKDPRIVHHDHLKFCKDREVPWWLTQLQTVMKQNQESQLETGEKSSQSSQITQSLDKQNPEQSQKPQSENSASGEKSSEVNKSKNENKRDYSYLDGIQDLFENQHQDRFNSRGRKIKLPTRYDNYQL